MKFTENYADTKAAADLEAKGIERERAQAAVKHYGSGKVMEAARDLSADELKVFMQEVPEPEPAPAPEPSEESPQTGEEKEPEGEEADGEGEGSENEPRKRGRRRQTA